MTLPQRSAREALDRCAAFADVPRDVLETVGSCLEERAFGAGDVILRQGAQGDSLYVIVDGAASASLRDAEGGTRSLASFRTGDIVGEMALLTQAPRTVDVTADTAVRTFRLAGDDFERLARRYPEVAVVLTHVAADRLGRASIDGLSGKEMGRFRIRRCIGRGAMAMVYEANDVESDERVALKMMSHRLLFEAGAMARFQREADLLLQFDHPNIARVRSRFPAFRTWFMVMEFCDGPSLQNVVTRHGALAESQTRAIVGQVADALRFLHARDVVHRDLKPANVVLTATGVAKMIDFGLARPSRGGGTQLTSERTLVGTPMYMSPEQLSGHESTTAADLYGLGCLALELLLGRAPFSSASYFELVQAKASYVLPHAQSIGRGVSEEMREFLVAAMARDPAARRVDLGRIASWAAPADPALTPSNDGEGSG